MAKTAIGNGYQELVASLAKARKVEEGIKRMAENARRASDLAAGLRQATKETQTKR